MIQETCKSFNFAWQGVFRFFKEERNAKIQLLSLVIAIILGLVLDIAQSEWLAIILCGGLVLGLEMTNSALETTLDLVNPDFHPLVKKAKDLMAGAVLIAATTALIIAILIFYPYLTALLAQHVLANASGLALKV